MTARLQFSLIVVSIVLLISVDTGRQRDTQAISMYDSTLAQRLGADEYGMKRYVLSLLKAGPRRDQDSATAARLQEAHLKNINRLAQEGTLVLAGPFLDNGILRGIYLFNVTSLEEAKKLTETDPAVQAGRLVMQLHPWYGSAAIMQVNALHEKVA